MGAAWLERTDAVQSKDIFEDVKPHPRNALEATAARSYSHRGSVAVRLTLENPGLGAWTATGAELTDAMGAEVALSVWQESAIAPDAPVIVVVGAEKPAAQFGCPCILKLWEAQGPRIVTMGNITFPAAKQAPAPE